MHFRGQRHVVHRAKPLSRAPIFSRRGCQVIRPGAGSLIFVFLFIGATRDDVFVILSHWHGMSTTLTLQINVSPARFAKSAQKLNFHFQAFREKYNFPIITRNDWNDERQARLGLDCSKSSETLAVNSSARVKSSVEQKSSRVQSSFRCHRWTFVDRNFLCEKVVFSASMGLKKVSKRRTHQVHMDVTRVELMGRKISVIFRNFCCVETTRE